MEELTIMLLAYNDAENVRIAVHSIRVWADLKSIRLIVVDNHSSDGLRDWAATQEDFTYVYMDEGKVGYGRLINEVRRELDIAGDLLIMTGRYAITCQCLSRLTRMLHSRDEIGAIGGVGTLLNGQGLCNMPVFERYEEAVCYAQEAEQEAGEVHVLELDAEIILFRAEALARTGEFDEEFDNLFFVMRDYGLRLISNDYKLAICKNAVFFSLPCTGNEYTGVHEGELERSSFLMEKKWSLHYFNLHANPNLVNEIERDPEEEFAVLEIGCDLGATLLGIRNRWPHARICGTDLNEASIKIVSHVAEAMVNNIEEQNLPYDEGTFDYIIFGDVLEHLRDPAGALRYCGRLLKADGRIISSIPNLMNISVVERLLDGYFTYEETGLLDRTHIHLFTFNEIVGMYDLCGYEIENINMTANPVTEQQEQLIDQLLALGHGTARFMYETFQYILRVRKKQP